MKYVLLFFLSVFPLHALFAQAHFTHGPVQLSGADLGTPVLGPDVQWTTITRGNYSRLEDMFITPVQAGYVREYYIAVQSGDNISGCGNIKMRFWQSWIDQPAHEFNVNAEWGRLNEGRYKWVQVPSTHDQLTGMGLADDWNNRQNTYWRLEARLSGCTGSGGTVAKIMGVYVMAIDKPSADATAVTLVKNNDSVATAPGFNTLGRGDAIFTDSQGHVGLGIRPQARLHVMGENGRSYFDAGGGFHTIDFVGSGDRKAFFGYNFGYNLMTIGRVSNNTETFSLCFPADGSVGVGVMDTKGYKLAVGGSMIAEKIKVKMQVAWPDFVFDKDYRPMPLNDLAAYVSRHKHLPEIPSAADIAGNGLDVGEMNRLLLKKMEEMTLYMIELQRQHEALQQTVKQLQSEKVRQ